MITLRLLLLLLFCSPLYAQQYLYIKKTGEMPADRLSRMQQIRIKTAPEEGWIKGRIRAIDKSSLNIDGRTFSIDDIQVIRRENKWLKVGGNSVMIFAFIPLFNRLINGNRPLMYPTQIAIYSGLFAVGAGMRLLAPSTYRRSEGFTFEVIDLSSYE